MPRAREIMAVVPVFSAMMRFIKMNFGWVASPTALMAPSPRLPTIILSTMLTRLVRNSSHREGHAICTMSRYSSRLVMVSGRVRRSCLVL